MTFRTEFVVIGHRGAAGLAPENTLRSFARAIELGVDAIELDVHLKDGSLIVIHDDTLDRTTNGRGSIGSARLAEIRALDAGDGERVPLLEEVLDLVAGRVAVNVELKGKNTARRTASVCAHYPNTEFLVSSFDLDELRNFRVTTRAVRVAPLFGRARPDIFDIARELRTSTINVSRKIASLELLATAKQQRYDVFVYTVNDPREALALREGGARGVFTDYPDRVK